MELTQENLAHTFTVLSERMRQLEGYEEPKTTNGSLRDIENDPIAESALKDFESYLRTLGVETDELIAFSFSLAKSIEANPFRFCPTFCLGVMVGYVIGGDHLGDEG